MVILIIRAQKTLHTCDAAKASLPQKWSSLKTKMFFSQTPKNKQRFISHLGGKLENANFKVLNAEDDADLLIVKTGIKLGKERKVLVVAEDTDILVLLWDMMSHDILLGTEPKRAQKAKLWDIKRTKMLLGEELCQLLPAIHSLTGCDTTSKPSGIGKTAALKKIKSTNYIQETLKTFYDISASTESILQSGSEVISSLYGGVPYEGLDILRLRKFGTKVAAGSISVQVQSLPPTADAANFHIKQAY